MDTNVYDSNATLLFKWAEQFGIPSIFIIVRRINGTLNFINPIREMIEKIINGISISQIYTEYNFLNERISMDFIIYLFYITLKDGVNKEILLQHVADFERINRKGGIIQFNKIADLVSFEKSYAELYQNFLAEDRTHLANIRHIQSKLTNIKEHLPPNSPLDIYGSTLVFKPIYMKTRGYPNIINGLDIFNEIRATKFVPYIQYNNEMGESFYKILKGDLNYRVMGVLQQQTKNSGKNTFYATVCLDNADDIAQNNTDAELYDSASITDAPSGSFYRLVYDINDGIMTINMPNKTKANQVTESKEVINRILSAFSGFNIIDIEEKRVRGYFDIYGVEIEEMTFLHMLFDHEIFYSYLYTEEKLRPFAYKHRLDIHYHGILSTVGTQVQIITEKGDKIPLETPGVSLTLQPQRVTEDKGKLIKYLDPNNQVKEGIIPKGTYWIHFIINGPTNPALLEESIKILRVLLYIYRLSKDELKNIYIDAFGADTLRNFNDRYYIVKKDPKNKQKEGEDVQRVKLLKEKDPELFVKDYASVCQSPGQPSIIDDKDVEAWKQETFTFKGEVYNKQVMPFPKNNPRWNMVCTSSARPFIGVKENTKLSNKDKFPYVPCCFRSNHMDPNAESYYNEYYHGKEVEPKAAKAKIVNRTNKIRTVGQIAILPPELENMLAYYREDDLPGSIEDWKIVRTGVYRSKNSLLHCISVSVNDPNYMGVEENLERYVTKLRSQIANNTDPDLLRQELYDKTPKQIKEMLADTNSFLDPHIFYRAVEEFYQINIFVYSLEKDTAIVQIPRHKLFHSRPLRLNRPTVLILSHMGSESDSLEYPQCEMIIDFNSVTSNIVNLFGPNMTTICHQLMTGVDSNITWLQHTMKPVKITEAAHPVYPHLNFFNAIDYADLFGIGIDNKGQSTLYSQYIDPNGKARAFTLNRNGRKITFVIPPSMPENVKHSETLYRPKSGDVLEMMRGSRATAKSINKYGQITGIWFQALELEEGIYVPVYKTRDIPKEISGLPIGSVCPIGKTDEMNNTKRYYKIKKSLIFLNEIIEWLFEINRKEVRTIDIDIDAFCNNVFLLREENVQDSSTYYNFNNLPRILPEMNTLEDALIYLSDNITPMENNKLVVYSNKLLMGLRDKVRDYNDKTMGEEPSIARVIKSYFNMTTDFIQYPNNMIMMGIKELDKWQDDRILKKEKVFQIRTTLSLAISVTLDPYLYSNPEGYMWIIQNPSGGTLNGALAIARNWHFNRVNTGPNTTPLNVEEFPVHFVYIIAACGNLGVLQDLTGGVETYVNVLKYGPNNYGALLPLF